MDNYDNCEYMKRKITNTDSVKGWAAFDPITRVILYEKGFPMIYIQKTKPTVFTLDLLSALVKRIKISTI